VRQDAREKPEDLAGNDERALAVDAEGHVLVGAVGGEEGIELLESRIGDGHVGGAGYQRAQITRARCR
jgi:hypothetical protein